MEHGSSSFNNNRSTQSSYVPLQVRSPTRNEELRLPVRNMTRIMQRALPSYAKISQDAKASTQKCVSEFMGIIIIEVVDKCNEESRKIISGEDLIWAMGRLGFEDYVGPLSLLLQNYRNRAGGSSSGNGQH